MRIGPKTAATPRRGALMVAGILLMIGAFAILGFLLQFYSRESVYCIRDSLDFRLGITERVIRHFPTPHAVSGPGYYFSCGDGPKPAEQEVVFESALDTDRLRTLLQEHIVQCGYTLSARAGDLEWCYSKANKSLFLKIERNNSASKVRASVAEQLW